MEHSLLEVQALSKYFKVKAGSFSEDRGRGLRAVHNVSFSISRGKTLGLVGESGCGKSTTGRLILRLIEPSGGRIVFDGADITSINSSKLKDVRRRMQIVFQDPLGSLNPRQTVGSIITEPLLVHGYSPTRRRQRLAELLEDVELPREAANKYPHEFSGGQRQRVAIARALALSPELIVADEPVSALDASIQSQILMLLKKLQEEHNLSYLFISHDLAVVRFLCHEVAVMYLGEIVEFGPVGEVYGNPSHPYTRALLKAIPQPLPEAPPVVPLEGQVPNAADPPPGCPFSTRCSLAQNRCKIEEPPVYQVSKGHYAKCVLNENIQSPSESRGNN